MNWRDLIANAIITLIVTIVAGIVLWLLTKQPDVPIEKIVYSIDTTSGPSIDQKELSFITIRIANVGRKAAKNVRMIIDFDGASEIVEKQIKSSIGQTFQPKISQEIARLDIVDDTLVPDEVIWVISLVKGVNRPLPKIAVKSDESVGIIGDTYKAKEEHNLPSFLILVIIVGIALIVQALLVSALSRLRLVVFRRSLNDTAFLLIQKKFLTVAEKILNNTVLTKGAGAFEFANYGLIIGLLGNPGEAEKYFSVAEWLNDTYAAPGSNSLRAVLEFNKATLAMHSGDFTAAAEHLHLAFEKNRKEIAKYCKVSEYVKEAVIANNEIRKVVQS